MHGCGNDYIFVDCFTEEIHEPAAAARLLSDRHTGIGGDGLVLITPSSFADFSMQMFNADGSEGKMCGNAIRCAGRYFFEHRKIGRTEINVETKSGIRKLWVHPGEDFTVTVDMGHPSFLVSQIPMKTPHTTFLNQELVCGTHIFRASAVSVGNPHLIILGGNVEELGPAFNQSALFPDGVNVSCIQVKDEEHIDALIWERGSGMTLSCGTAACACTCACVLAGLTKEKVLVRQPGGTLKAYYDKDHVKLFLTGDANYVFSGST